MYIQHTHISDHVIHEHLFGFSKCLRNRCNDSSITSFSRGHTAAFILNSIIAGNEASLCFYESFNDLISSLTVQLSSDNSDINIRRVSQQTCLTGTRAVIVGKPSVFHVKIRKQLGPHCPQNLAVPNKIFTIVLGTIQYSTTFSLVKGGSKLELVLKILPTILHAYISKNAFNNN